MESWPFAQHPRRQHHHHVHPHLSNNNTDEGRELNRRVELKVTDSSPDAAAPAQAASNTFDLLAMLNLEEVERFSGYAAAAAEVDPASLNAQIRLFYFRTALMQKMPQVIIL